MTLDTRSAPDSQRQPGETRTPVYAWPASARDIEIRIVSADWDAQIGTATLMIERSMDNGATYLPWWSAEIRGGVRDPRNGNPPMLGVSLGPRSERPTHVRAGLKLDTRMRCGFEVEVRD